MAQHSMSPDQLPAGRTRWRRFAVAAVPATAAVVGLGYLAATGALAVSIGVSGIPFKLSASSLTGTGFVQYGTVSPVTKADSQIPAAARQTVAGAPAGNGDYVASTITALSSANLTALHQTVCADIPSIGGLLTAFGSSHAGKLLVTIDAGNNGTPVQASNLMVNAPLLTADSAVFTNMNIGVDAGQAMGSSANGLFAQMADSVNITNVAQTAISTTAGSFNLAGLNLSASFVSACP